VISDPDGKYRVPELSHGLRLHFVYMTTDACALPEPARTLELLRGYRMYWGESDQGCRRRGAVPARMDTERRRMTNPPRRPCVIK
jgi:hypothetical protein